MNQTSTSEIFFDDSNDSTNNNLNAIMGSVSEATLNPHKIRIKQQKIFLKYNNNNTLNDESNIHMNPEELKINQIENETFQSDIKE
jgi:hypothetical protein